MDILIRNQEKKRSISRVQPQEEFFNPDSGIITPQEQTELGQALDNLNNDDLDFETRMSNIDMRARLHHIEASSVLALDGLVALNVLPQKCLAFSRQKKRLSVSIAGKGREEIVSITKGKREDDITAGKTLAQKLNPFSG